MSERAVRILLVEDDEDDYVLTRDHLAQSTRTGFSLVWAPTYEEGLERALAGEADVPPHPQPAVANIA